MGFIFPELHPGFDAMFCIAKLIEMLTLRERSLGQIWSDLPRVTHRIQTLRCPLDREGSPDALYGRRAPPRKTGSD